MKSSATTNTVCWADGHQHLGLARDPVRRTRGGGKLDLSLYRGEIEVVAVDRDQAEAARIAWRRFGKGRHPAALTYGDCFAYTLAQTRRLPLSFRGEDFARTDIAPVSID